jgi:hypothetical protein
MDNETILNQLPIDRAACFSNEKGEPSDKVKRNQGKVLAKAGPFLQKFLEPEERILYAAPAVAPISALEQFFKGWHVYYLKSCLLVLTTRRIVCLPTTTGGKPRRMLSQARYGDLAGFKAKGVLGGTLELSYKSGKKESFTVQSGGDRKKAEALLSKLVPGGEPTDRRERHHLCPRCAKPLTKDKHLCPSCRLAFKTPGQAVRFALLVPGGGFFMTGHVWFGVQSALAELIIFIMFLSTLVAAHGKVPLMGASIFLLGMVVVNKLVAIDHARYYVRQFMPADKTP